jgi:hypothetical protein
LEDRVEGSITPTKGCTKASLEIGIAYGSGPAEAKRKIADLREQEDLRVRNGAE